MLKKKELTVKEVRALPIGAKVTAHGNDKYGYPCTMLCEVVGTRSGRGKELRFNTWNGFDRMPIRANKTYTVEVMADEDH